MGKQKKYFLLIAAVCILLCSCQAKRKSLEYIEDPSWSKVMVKSVLVIGLSDYVPPLAFRDENNRIVGYDVDIMKEVCRRIGVRPVFYPIDWEQKEELLNTEVIDCIISGFSMTEERKPHYTFTHPYLQNVQLLLTLAEKNYQKISQLQGKTIGVEAGTVAADALRNAGYFQEPIPFYECNTIADLYTALDSGVCEAIIVDLVYSLDIIKDSRQYKIMNEPIASEYYTFAFRKTDKTLVAKVESALQAMNKDKTIVNLSHKWFDANLSVINVQ